MDQASILYRQFPGIAATNTQGKQWEDAGCFGVSGAQGRIRTTDTRIFSPLLYQLFIAIFQ